MVAVVGAAVVGAAVVGGAVVGAAVVGGAVAGGAAYIVMDSRPLFTEAEVPSHSRRKYRMSCTGVSSRHRLHLSFT